MNGFNAHLTDKNHLDSDLLLGPRRGSESENATVFLAERGVMVPGVPCVDRGNWGQDFAFVSTVFCGEFFGKNRALYIDFTYNDVDRFRKGSVHDL